MFLCDLFLIIKNAEFGSYAIENSPYTAVETPEKVFRKLDKETKKYFEGL